MTAAASGMPYLFPPGLGRDVQEHEQGGEQQHEHGVPGIVELRVAQARHGTVR